ncbi:MAG: hypothetical protein IT381_09020 [Deltaproteobacteria bacterium]|nr:hypothetical protein [Deltaproteobacteria bacterium]
MRRTILLVLFAACAPKAPPPPPWKTSQLAVEGPWPKCEGVVPGTLAARAEVADWAAVALNQLPADHPWTMIYDVTLAAPAPNGVSDAPPAVEDYQSSDNSGLFSSLYLASQAFRYATTHEAAALANVQRVLRGLELYMRVTGVPGLFTREVRDSVTPGFLCPDDPDAYFWPPERNRNAWVKIGEDGCGTIWDGVAWQTIDACPGAEFAGLCWKRNTSRDEYSGDMFALAVVAKLVDDPLVQATVKTLARAAGDHLIAHAYAISDADGLPTRYGHTFAFSFAHFPGFLAMQALAWTETAMRVGASDEIAAYYDACLLQKKGKKSCIDQPIERDSPMSYKEHMQTLPIALGSCLTNYDNVSMAALAYFESMFLEPDAAVRAETRALVEKGLRTDQGHDVREELNAFLNVIAAAAGERHDGAAETMVRDAACALAAMPAMRTQRSVANDDVAEICVSPRHGSIGATVRPIERRCENLFVWWRNPRARDHCDADARVVMQPTGYLLPYWMGRYFRFFAADD